MHSINDAFDHANHLCGQNNGSNKSQFIGKLHCLLTMSHAPVWPQKHANRTENISGHN